MKPFFTLADCDVDYPAYGSIQEGRLWAITPEKANRLLEERGMVVYSDRAKWDNWNQYEINDEHNKKPLRALVINIEKIEKPDTLESLLKEIIKVHGLGGGLVERAERLLEGKKCEHKNSRISEPHLAGAIRCNDCGAYRPSASGSWSIEVLK